MFFKKEESNPPAIADNYSKVINYIKIDAINNKPMKTFHWDYGEKKKGLFAGRTEIVYLTPGEYNIVAHGVTYQTTQQIL